MARARGGRGASHEHRGRRAGCPPVGRADRGGAPCGGSAGAHRRSERRAMDGEERAMDAEERAMSLVETRLDRDVMTITLADEERRNVLSAQLTTELVEAFERADTDPAVRVVVLTNKGRAFCAGA